MAVNPKKPRAKNIRIHMGKRLSVRGFLLEEGKYKGIQARIINGYLQTKLRQTYRDDKYKCPVCRENGFLLTEKAEQILLEELDKLSDLAGTNVSLALNSMLSTSNTKTGEYSGASIAYEKLKIFRKIPGLKGKLIKYRKNLKRNLKKSRTLFDDAEEAKRAYSEVEKIMSNIVGICPYCAGAGYLDVGHKSMEGKTVKLLSWVFHEYALKGKQYITVKQLWEEFSDLTKYPIEPQWALSPGLDASGVALFSMVPAVNRYADYTNAMQAAKNSLKKDFEEFYKTGGLQIKEEDVLTFEAILKFFPILINTSRVDTGTLKQRLQNEYRQLQQDFTYYKSRPFDNINPITHEKGHKYPLHLFFFKAPTKYERGKLSKNERSKLYVYANRFSNMQDGKVMQGSRVFSRWGKNTPLLSDMVAKVFTSKQMEFLRFFPQEYA